MTICLDRSLAKSVFMTAPPRKRRRSSRKNNSSEPATTTQLTALGGDVRWAWHIVPLQNGKQLAATCEHNHVRLFGLPGQHSTVRSFRASVRPVLSMCALSADVVLTGWCCGMLATFRGSTGRRIATLSIGGEDAFATAMAPLGARHFVVGTVSGELRFFEHANGGALRELARRRKAHAQRVCNIAVYDDVLATASADSTARVWNGRSCARLADLPHPNPVFCVSLNRTRVATGAQDEVRIFRNGGDYALQFVIPNVHDAAVLRSVTLIGEELLLTTAGADSNLVFICLAQKRPLVRTSVKNLNGIYGAAVLADGRIAVCGMSDKSACGAIVEPPFDVSGAVRAHGMSLFLDESDTLAFSESSPMENSFSEPRSLASRYSKPESETDPLTSPSSVIQGAESLSPVSASSEIFDKNQNLHNNEILDKGEKLLSEDEILSIMRQWAKRGASSDVVSGLDANELSDMMSSYILGYSSRYVAKFQPLKQCLRTFFEDNCIRGEVLTGEYRLDENEVHDGIMDAFAADSEIGRRLGHKVLVRKFLSQVANTK